MQARTLLRVVALASVLLVLAAAAQAERRPLTPDEGDRVARAALRFAHVEYFDGDATVEGVPYLWGGRLTVEEFLDRLAGGESPRTLGTDASGVAVAALRALDADLRFAGAPDGQPAWLPDATSAILYRWNVTHVSTDDVQPGDLIFFRGETGDGISGVGIVTGSRDGRVEFVVASAREGRVVHTFLRTAGDYWQTRVAAIGRFLLPPR